LQHTLDRIAHVLVKIELLLDRAAAMPGKFVLEV
jgi:ribosome maturation factor RimP